MKARNRYIQHARIVSFIKYLAHPTLPYLSRPILLPLSSAAYAKCKNIRISSSSQCYVLSIPHTRLHIPIIRISTSPSSILSFTLCTTHPSTLWHGSATPSLLHGRRPGLVASWLSGSAAASGDAAEDGDEEESAYAGGDTDDEVFVVVDPAADFFGS